jgi:uncharacterized membrane protein YfcA
MNVIHDPLFYIVACLAIIIVGISKSGFGGGLGVLGVPLMSLVIPPPQAAAILLPLLCVMDFFAIKHYWKQWDIRNLLILLPAAIGGVLIGTQCFKYFSVSHLRLLVGVIAIYVFLNYLFKKETSEPSQRLKIPHRIFWATLDGFTSFSAHAGGPGMLRVLLPQRLTKTAFVGTTVLLFGTINVLKLVPYTLLGQFTTQNLGTSLVLAPVAPIGIWLGVRLHHVIDEKMFYRLCYAFLVVVGIKLIYDGLAGMQLLAH